MKHRVYPQCTYMLYNESINKKTFYCFLLQKKYMHTIDQHVTSTNQAHIKYP